jgi:hypothetical protein
MPVKDLYHLPEYQTGFDRKVIRLVEWIPAGLTTNISVMK